MNQHDELPASGSGASGESFSDPYLSLQWHYNNTGKINHAAEGADIRLFDAWRTTTGHPDVIVAVVDGGIDYTHVDLAANIWVNTAEKNGTASKDDDANGYKDDIYGYNFVTGRAIEPTLHGTHVAGIIGAVNNNGIGVGGIAGGDGTANSGVRLMSCQVFLDDEQGERSATNFYTAAAIKYGADNGAVICQNSWGFDLGTVSSTPTLIKEAIDYFIANAGMDEHGNQEGPMKGGIVLFAAGNDNTSSPSYPAFDDNVISVAAMGPDYVRATYSNYGPTVDIIAPGGEMSHDPVRGRTGVLSTGAGWDGTGIAKNAYYYMDGTSMSCPQVSGIAALIVSHYGVGTPGFTSAQLKERLYAATYDISVYNNGYDGKLGVGALDGGKAFLPDVISPQPPVLRKSVPNLAFTRLDDQYTLMLGDYFASAEENDELVYNVSVGTDGIISFHLVNNELQLTTAGYGKTNVTLTVTGKNGLQTKAGFLVSCSSRTKIPGGNQPGLWTWVGSGELKGQ